MTKEERLEQLLTQLGYDEYDRCSMYTVKDLMLRFADSESQRVIDKACKWFRAYLIETCEETIGYAALTESLIDELRKAMNDKTE